MRKALAGLLLFVAAGCAHKVQTKVTPPVPVVTAPAELAYRDGLKAFRLATPEGYERATGAFRKAADLDRKSCEYAMHLAEALYLHARQQRLNWEEYGDSVSEANAVLEFKRTAPECNAFESYLTRLRALSLTFASVPSSQAVAMIRQAIDVDPDDPMNWLVLSQLEQRPRRDPLAPSEHAVALAPDMPLAQYELGNYLLLDTATFAKAKLAFERVLELSPRHFQAIIGIVYSLSTEGDDAAARIDPLMHQAVEIAPTSLKARTLLGDYYAGLEETELAVEQYTAATSTNSKYYPAHLAQGTTLATAERYDPAEKSFRTVLELDVKRPHPPFNGVDFAADAQAHYYLGNIWLDRGSLPKARAEYEAAVADVGNYGGAIYGLGIVSYREGKIDEALRDLDQVLTIDSKRFPNAFLARGGIRGERRQYKDALHDFDAAIEIYRQQLVGLDAKIQLDEAKGLKRRAEGNRRRKAQIDATLQKAMESRKAIEPFVG